MAVMNITKDNFEQEVLHSEKPVLVDFYADWCATCKMMAPMIEEIAEEAEHIKVVKLNITGEMALARKYGVMGIPAFVVFQNGEAVKRAAGEKTKLDLMEMLQIK